MIHALLVSLLVITATAHAELKQEQAQLTLQVRSARFQRNLGWGLAAVGFGLLAAGAVATGFGIDDATQSYDQHVVEVLAGVGTMAVGLAFAIPGMVLALRGQNAMTDATWRLRAIAAPVPSGGMVGARLLF